MRLFADYQVKSIFNGASLGGQSYGIAANNGYITGIIDHLKEAPFAEVLLLNFKANGVPTTGKLIVRAWREEFSSFAFDSATEGAYKEAVTFARPYGVAPIIAEIPYADMISGGQPVQMNREIDIGAGFNKNIPDRYRLIFENSTDVPLSSANLRYQPNLGIVYAMFAGMS